MKKGTKSTSVSKANIHRHDKYYLKDGVIFQVEDCLFKVPRYMLESTSPVFASMFSMPSGQDEPEGQTDSAPINLPQTSRVDFVYLMEFLYPLTIDTLSQGAKMNKSQWISILRLAKMWQMDKIRDLAITNIQNILPRDTPPMEMILLGREFDQPEWFKIGFNGLCQRREPLTQEEASQLGMEAVIKLAAAREKMRTAHRNRELPSANRHDLSVSSSTTTRTRRSLDTDNDENKVMRAISGVFRSKPKPEPEPEEVVQCTHQ